MNPNTKKILVWSSAIILLGVGGYVGYRLWKKAKDKREEEKKRLEELAAQAAQQNQGGGGGGYQGGGGGGGTVTPEIPAEVDTPEELKAFQKWVINTKGDKTILGKGGDSGFGDDGKWGSKSKAAWDKYGADYKKTLNPEKPDDKPVQISADLQKDIDLIGQFGEGEKRKSSYLKGGIDKQPKKDWIKAWANAIRARVKDSNTGTTFVWKTGGEDWGLFEAYSGERILGNNPVNKNPDLLASAVWYKEPKESWDFVGALSIKAGKITGYRYIKKDKMLWLFVEVPNDSKLSDAWIMGYKWIPAKSVKFA